nr:MAG TPA: hypothetical protein [Caudoviricetes sp.]
MRKDKNEPLLEDADWGALFIIVAIFVTFVFMNCWSDRIIAFQRAIFFDAIIFSIFAVMQAKAVKANSTYFMFIAEHTLRATVVSFLVAFLIAYNDNIYVFVNKLMNSYL